MDFALLCWILDEADGKHISCVLSTAFIHFIFRSQVTIYLMFRTVRLAMAVIQIAPMLSLITTAVPAVAASGPT